MKVNPEKIGGVWQQEKGGFYGCHQPRGGNIHPPGPKHARNYDDCDEFVDLFIAFSHSRSVVFLKIKRLQIIFAAISLIHLQSSRLFTWLLLCGKR